MCGKGSQTTTQNTSQTQTPNPQAMALYNSILQQAQQTAGTPYSPFSGELVAPVNPQQSTGIANINAYQPAFGTGLGMAYQAAQPITAAQIQQYESPYTQDVINATMAQFANQNAQQQATLTGNAAAQGALGGDRIGVAQANLVNQEQLAQAPVIANLQNQGYMTGLNTALTEQQALAQGAYGVANMANAGLGGANAQIGAGTLQQTTQQAQDTANYQQYLAAMGYPFQTAQWLAGIGTGVGSQMGGTTTGTGTVTAPAPNMLATLLGAGVAGAGVAGNLGWKPFGSSTARRGGRIETPVGVANYQSGGSASANYPVFGGGYGQSMTPYSSSKSFVPGIGITHGRGPPPGMNMSVGQQQQQQGSGVDFSKLMGLGKGSGSGSAGSNGVVPADGAGYLDSSIPSDLNAGVAGVEAPAIGDVGAEVGGDMAVGGAFDLAGLGADAGAGAAADLLPLLLLAKRGGRINRGSNGVAGYQGGGAPDDVPIQMAALEPGDTRKTMADIPPPPPSEDEALAYGPDPTTVGLISPNQVPTPKERPVGVVGSLDSQDVPSPRNLPRGMRNNNPGNIEDGPFARAQPGYAGSDGRFAQFDSMESGQAATSSLLGSYGNKGINTLSGIINRWAPAADNNDTNAYIRAVSKATGFNPNEPLDMSDPSVRNKIASAIHAHENGMPGGMLPGYMAGDYQRAYGGLDIPASMQSTARAQAPSGVAGGRGVSPDLWPALMAAGFGMMASRSPFLGVALGEGGLQGLGTYSALKQQEQAAGFNQQKIDQEAAKLAEEADWHQKEYQVNLMRAHQEQLSPIAGYETAEGHPVAYDKRSGQTMDLVTNKPIDPDANLRNTKLTWKPMPNKVTDTGNPVMYNGQGQFMDASTHEMLGPGAKITDAKVQSVSDDQINSRGHQLAIGDVKSAYNGFGYGNNPNRGRVYDAALKELTENGGMSTQQAAEYLSQQTQEWQARGTGLNAEARTAGTREANLNLILRAANAAIPAAIEQSKNVWRSGFVPLNEIYQKIQEKTADPAMTTFGMANLQLAEHWARAMNPTGVMREEDRDLALKYLNTATSQPAYEAAVKQLQVQINRELSAVQGFRKENGNVAMGKPDGLTADSARTELSKGTTPTTAPARPAATPPATPAPAPIQPTQPAAPTFTRAQAEDWLAKNPDNPLAPQVRDRLKTMP